MKVVQMRMAHMKGALLRRMGGWRRAFPPPNSLGRSCGRLKDHQSAMTRSIGSIRVQQGPAGIDSRDAKDPISALLIYLVAFVCGAIVMSFEMLGSRYLNPYFGSGIYTWAALISTSPLGLCQRIRTDNLRDRKKSAVSPPTIDAVPAASELTSELAARYAVASPRGASFKSAWHSRISSRLASRLMLMVLRHASLDNDAMRTAYITAVTRMSSDYERSRVLQTIVTKSPASHDVGAAGRTWACEMLVRINGVATTEARTRYRITRRWI
jgi:hypothetical protein